MTTYYGGKNKVYQTIINQIPPHNTYIELCLGSGAVMRHKKPAINNIGVDPDGSIIDRFVCPGHMEFYNQSCFNFLDDYNALDPIATFIYADPPYLFETRFNQRQQYNFEFTRDDHIRLLGILRNVESMVCISGYDSSLYNQMLSGWRKVIYYQYDRQGRKRE